MYVGFLLIVSVLCSSVTDGGTINSVEIRDSSLNNTEQCIQCLEDILNQTKCHEICGSDGSNNDESATKLDIDQLIAENMAKIREVDVTQDHDMMNDEGMAKRLRLEADRIFQGIIISLILFMTCASICFISACVYCCRMSYQDRKLERDVKALAKKLKKDYHTKTPARQPLPAISESCNVVVGEAGIFVC